MARAIDEFMAAFPFEGLTFDDISLVTQYADFLPAEADVRSNFTRHVKLNIPFVSAAIGYRHPVWESNAHRRQVYREVLATHSSPDTDIVNGRGIIKKTYGNTTYIDYARPEKKRTSSLREKTSDKTVKNYKKDTSGNRKTAIGNRNENKTKNTSGNRDRDRIVNSPYKTKPKIYMSSIEDRLIYDYPDRFEVYIIEGETKRLDRTEYK